MQPGLLGAISPEEQRGLLEPAQRPMRGDEAIGRARQFLGREPGYTYGEMLPMRQSQQTGGYGPAVPGFARDFGVGLLDMLEGQMTPEASMSLLDIPTARAASAAIRGALPDPNQLGIFAGAGAKTADKAALETAQRMAGQGADPRSIWRDTGWFKAPDGRWRWEIDDSGADFVPSVARSGATSGFMPDVFPHQALQHAYPEMGGLPMDARVAPYGGHFDLPSRQNPTGSVRSFAENDVTRRSIMLHELQHGAQAAEGFDIGNSAINHRGIWDRDESYMRGLGEVEARAVQRRSDLTMQQRRDRFPVDDYDRGLSEITLSPENSAAWADYYRHWSGKDLEPKHQQGWDRRPPRQDGARREWDRRPARQGLL